MRSRPILLSLLVVGLLSSAFARQGESGQISIGSAVPPLSVKTWLKGTPLTELDPNKTYVVEFWATWCGPCITSIPHVTKLAKENPDVTFMGIGIWEDEGPQLKAFVEKMGDKMGYNVGYSGNQEGMATTWMTAAAQNGIPSAFIVKGGKIMWIGHPMRMDKPLAEIKAGTFDVAAFKATFDEEAEKARKEMAVNEAFSKIRADFEDGKRAEAKAALTAFVTEHPEMSEAADRMRFAWLSVEDEKAWQAKAEKMAASNDAKDIQRLTYFALSRAGATGGSPHARKAIGLALKAKPDDFMVLQYARAVYKKTGDTKLQLDATKRLIAVLPTSPAKDDADFRATLEKERDQLEEQVAKSGK